MLKVNLITKKIASNNIALVLNFIKC